MIAMLNKVSLMTATLRSLSLRMKTIALKAQLSTKTAKTSSLKSSTRKRRKGVKLKQVNFAACSMMKKHGLWRPLEKLSKVAPRYLCSSDRRKTSKSSYKTKRNGSKT